MVNVTNSNNDIIGDNEIDSTNDSSNAGVVAIVNKKDTTNSNPSIIVSNELLQMYYSHLFPFSLLYSWLSYDCSNNNNNNNTNSTTLKTNSSRNTTTTTTAPKYFTNREFSLTIEPTPGEEIYIRYQSYISQEEMQSAICKRIPKKIDIGGIYNYSPKDKNNIQGGTNSLQPIGRELIFDIDMDDYDSVRYCGCIGSQICCKCWKFMIMAVHIIDTSLRNDFNFQHIAWFYSGRRGIHAWVCDTNAISLTDEARNSIVKYLQLQFINNDKNKDMSLNELTHPIVHPMFQRAYSILEPMFIQYIIPESGHGLLANKEMWTKFLNEQLPDCAYDIKNNLLNKWNKSTSISSPEDKWNDVLIHVERYVKLSKSKKPRTSNGNSTSNNDKNVILSNIDRKRLENLKYEIVFRFTYPRLDVNVSKSRNHLLKSPFCIHPKSGRVCVPVSVNTINTFNPFTVPTVQQVLDELDTYNKTNTTTTTMTTDTDTTMKDSNDIDDNVENRQPSSRNGGTSTKTDIPNWKKTSLKQYYELFQKEFLEPLQKELRRKQRDVNDQRAAYIGDF